MSVSSLIVSRPLFSPFFLRPVCDSSAVRYLPNWSPSFVPIGVLCSLFGEPTTCIFIKRRKRRWRMSRFKGLQIETRLDYVSSLNINDIYLFLLPSKLKRDTNFHRFSVKPLSFLLSRIILKLTNGGRVISCFTKEINLGDWKNHQPSPLRDSRPRH